MEVTRIVDAEDRWKRVFLRMMVLFNEIRWQTVRAELFALTPFYIRNVEEPATSSNPTTYGVTKAEVLSRPRLTDSKVIRNMCGFSPDTCLHSHLKARGGKTYWFTCSQCVARWPRNQHEFIKDEI